MTTLPQYTDQIVQTTLATTSADPTAIMTTSPPECSITFIRTTLVCHDNATATAGWFELKAGFKYFNGVITQVSTPVLIGGADAGQNVVYNIDDNADTATISCVVSGPPTFWSGHSFIYTQTCSYDD